MRLGPGQSLGIKTGFVFENTTQLQNPISENVVNRLESKINEFRLKNPLPIEDKKVVNLEEFKAKKESSDGSDEIAPEKYNPNKNLQDRVDRANIVMQRSLQRIRRGRSGCRCDGEVKSSACRSRSCRNKEQQAQPIDIRANSPENKGSKRIRAAGRPITIPGRSKAA